MNGVITLDGTQKEQIQLKYVMNIFGSSMRPKNQNKKDEKYLTLMSVNDLWGREMLINAFQSRIFPANSGGALPSTGNDNFDRTLTLEPQSTSLSVKSAQWKGHKILPPKQSLQRLPLLLAQVKAGNNLKIFWMRSDKLFTHCIEKNKFQRKYTIIRSNQYKDEYNIHEFREQQDLWCAQTKA